MPVLWEAERLKQKPTKLNLQNIGAKLLPTLDLNPALTAGIDYTELARTAYVITPSIAAVVGGVLAQYVLKTVSVKGEPLQNLFIFDAQSHDGIIMNLL
jgi:hypothetical protein